MYKAGANRQDKNKICKLAIEGHSVEEIQAITLVKVAQVRAVIEQFKAGKLKVGKLDYTQGEDEHGLRSGAVGSAELDEMREENATLRDALAAQQAQIDAILAGQGGAEQSGDGNGGDVPNATAQAATLALDNNIDLAAVQGTGQDGQIVKGDVQAAIEAASKGGGTD